MARGPQADAIEICYAAENTLPFPFVQSNLGEGLLPFYPGYQWQTEGDYALWVRGPINAPKDGLSSLEQMRDLSLLPGTVAIQWQFTRPHQTIHFAAGEPFATLQLYPKMGLPHVEVEILPPQDDAATYVQTFQRMLDTSGLHELFQRLDAVPPTPSLRPGAAPQPTVHTQTGPNAWAATLHNPPPVSCLCPTYGRVALLEEAIYAFLQQDYPGPKELIVLNDYEQQTLFFDHPRERPLCCADVGRWLYGHAPCDAQTGGRL